MQGKNLSIAEIALFKGEEKKVDVEH